MTRFRVTLALPLLLLGATARAEPPPCKVSASAPARAWVGQQVVLRLRVLRRPEVQTATWLSGPAFPGFREDALPGLSGEVRVREEGVPYLVFEERHALFPVRAGRLEIPAARLQCTLHALPGHGAAAVVTSLAPLVIEAVPPPTEGRPDGWRGLVGDVRVEVQATPRQLTVGGVLHVSVSVEGEADVRDVPPPFGTTREIGSAELFADRPAVTGDPGERLRLRRVFSYRLVPRSAGTLTLPGIRVPTFDPKGGRYRVATSAPIAIRVDPPGGS